MKFCLSHIPSSFNLDDIEAECLYTGVTNKITWIADFGILPKLAIGLEKEPYIVGVGLTCDRRRTCLYINPDDQIISCCNIKVIYRKDKNERPVTTIQRPSKIC